MNFTGLLNTYILLLYSTIENSNKNHIQKYNPDKIKNVINYTF